MTVPAPSAEIGRTVLAPAPSAPIRDRLRTEAVNRQELEDFLEASGDTFRPMTEEAWTMEAHGVPLQAYVNVAKDRMRIMAAVGSVEDLEPGQARHLLRSGFHTDARYAIYGDAVYAVFVHSLSSLCESDLRTGLRQVTELAESFGADYTRSPMRFQWPRPSPEDAQRGGVRRRTEDAVKRSVEMTRRHREGTD